MDRIIMDKSFRFIAGVDEAGRGPLAGPVFAAAVILNPTHNILELTDSKLLTEKKREKLFTEITEKCISYSVAFSSVAEIDEMNIFRSSCASINNLLMSFSKSGFALLITSSQ